MMKQLSGQATKPQMDFIQALLDDKAYDQARVLEIAPSRDMDKAQASALIVYLKGCPKKGGDAAKAPAPEGMHKLGDKIYKVQIAVHGSGKPYAKELVQYGDSFSFEYAPGAVSKLSEDTKMTLEQAKEFGALYGTCCVCGRTLTQESSIEAGIGPICAGKFA